MASRPPESRYPDNAAARASPPTIPPVVSSRDLLGAGRELVIQHGAERYRLLLTIQDKLILTK